MAKSKAPWPGTLSAPVDRRRTLPPRARLRPGLEVRSRCQTIRHGALAQDHPAGDPATAFCPKRPGRLLPRASCTRIASRNDLVGKSYRVRRSAGGLAAHGCRRSILPTFSRRKSSGVVAFLLLSSGRSVTTDPDEGRRRERRK